MVPHLHLQPVQQPALQLAEAVYEHTTGQLQSLLVDFNGSQNRLRHAVRTVPALGFARAQYVAGISHAALSLRLPDCAVICAAEFIHFIVLSCLLLINVLPGMA